ncbi:MAG TPA: DUF4288 domain-containing protein [Chitinophagaceae bacterium]|nr:DUF4288 domain-containing protein [Chitinophagaceae bacterium]
MNWYIAKLVFRIISGKGNHKPQFDEQLRLIQASNELEALRKAEKLGTESQETFFNNRNETVQWKWTGVADLHQLHDLSDGVEICSHIEEVDNADIYEEIVRRKSAYLHGDHILKSLQLA